jgi:TrmH family RNA methyltransferase
MGNEQAGLPEELSSTCDALARIPQVGDADSLNLAIATGLMIYEARRHLLELDLLEPVK